MLTVTREGKVTGDYWEGLRKVEKERAKIALMDREKRHEEDYKKAIEKPRKKRLYDLYGDEVFRLFREEEMSYMQITKVLGISKESVRLILKEKEAEKWHRAQDVGESSEREARSPRVARLYTGV